jgi:hypothetical protein
MSQSDPDSDIPPTLMIGVRTLAQAVRASGQRASKYETVVCEWTRRFDLMVCYARGAAGWLALMRQGADPNRSIRKSRKTRTFGRRWRPAK